MSNSDLPLITASVPSFASLKTLSNVLLIVSVNTYVPEIIATPNRTATPVRSARTLRESRPRMVSAAI